MLPNKGSRGEEIIKKYQIVSMGARPHYRCPWCNSSDKERLVYSYLLRRTELFSNAKHSHLLHIAPEKNTRSILKTQPNIQYVSGDKFEGDERYHDGRYGDSVYLDVTDLDFEDDTFDVVICNHVLEHVIEDTKAMEEVWRVLKPQGLAILQVPVSRIIPETLEETSSHMHSSEERIQKYGQADHVRIYAEKDYMERLTRSKFFVQTIDPTDFLSIEEMIRSGINQSEKIYVAKKLSVKKEN